MCSFWDVNGIQRDVYYGRLMGTKWDIKRIERAADSVIKICAGIAMRIERDCSDFYGKYGILSGFNGDVVGIQLFSVTITGMHVP